MSLTPAEVRARLVEALRLDLVGPGPDDQRQDERLAMAPGRFYLTGFLVPFEAPIEERTLEDAAEQLDATAPESLGADEDAPDPPSARKASLPSSLGLSVLLPAGTEALTVTACWADYKQVSDQRDQWQRASRKHEIVVAVPPSQKAVHHDLEDDHGAQLVVSVREVPPHRRLDLPPGTRVASIFLVNHRKPSAKGKDVAYMFQAGLMVRCDVGFVARPNLRGKASEDEDERIGDLQYADAVEYAVGHGVAAEATVEPDGTCREVSSAWMPGAHVHRVIPATLEGDLPLTMREIADASDSDALRARLAGLPAAYGTWIAGQRQQVPADRDRAAVAHQLLDQAEGARARIATGIAALADPQTLRAFQLANGAMAEAGKQRWAQTHGKPADQAPEPAWRPFQLAFFLLNLAGLAEPNHADRTAVDLLFFPTGGGKTEAYLGLAAFTLLHRRLRQEPGDRLGGAGVAVLMRYTLRLLTLDQLGRAATLVCALERKRQELPAELGTWPFEIGLWVGQAATPNKMGKKGDGNEHSARKKTLDFLKDDRKPAPIPLETCPWCGAKFGRLSFQLLPKEDQPRDLRVVCMQRGCAFYQKALPLLAVDEPIYRRLPAFLIATVDKFAALPWTGQTGALFGGVERYDGEGFYGPCDPGLGRPLPGRRLPPPDLIIQDELHLISGPLGTVAGLYETAIDALCGGHGDRPRPKIVASTATVRRAEAQIRAIFGRERVAIFPPPGPDRRDAFFARTVEDDRTARLYLGVAAPGRSPKVTLLRTYAALLGAAQRAYNEAGGDRAASNPADAYMTLVGYFNSLRELGGSRRIVEDEVRSRVAAYGTRGRVNEETGDFASRKLSDEVVELTSRESTAKVADTKRRLALAHSMKERVDVAMATNMISVGLDITRLGLMVVLGQPKTTAEYIQATSRVGREPERQGPGLVVVILLTNKPRDRSHYERFGAFHASFYRAVEATSVTPFSPRALDRALAAVTVAAVRHGWSTLTPADQALAVEPLRGELDAVIDAFTERAGNHRTMTLEDENEVRTTISTRMDQLLDLWSKIAKAQAKTGATLQYGTEASGPALLRMPLEDPRPEWGLGGRLFKANRSMRDVEPTVGLWVRRLGGALIEDGE